MPRKKTPQPTPAKPEHPPIQVFQPKEHPLRLELALELAKAIRRVAEALSPAQGSISVSNVTISSANVGIAIKGEE
jgi:hypothetical protein